MSFSSNISVGGSFRKRNEVPEVYQKCSKVLTPAWNRQSHKYFMEIFYGNSSNQMFENTLFEVRVWKGRQFKHLTFYISSQFTFTTKFSAFLCLQCTFSVDKYYSESIGIK